MKLFMNRTEARLLILLIERALGGTKEYGFPTPNENAILNQIRRRLQEWIKNPEE